MENSSPILPLTFLLPLTALLINSSLNVRCRCSLVNYWVDDHDVPGVHLSMDCLRPRDSAKANAPICRYVVSRDIQHLSKVFTLLKMQVQRKASLKAGCHGRHIFHSALVSSLDIQVDDISMELGDRPVIAVVGQRPRASTLSLSTQHHASHPHYRYVGWSWPPRR